MTMFIKLALANSTCENAGIVISGDWSFIKKYRLHHWMNQNTDINRLRNRGHLEQQVDQDHGVVPHPRSSLNWRHAT